jgi:hypothetical protein
MKKLNILIFSLFGLFILSSCSDMLETDSELVEYEKDNTLNHATDSVYSVMGIINKMQVIADRTVLLGEARADLMVVTDAATSDLKRLASFDMAEKNKYNSVSDYYAIINNCNYFLAHVDTALTRRGRKLFREEYAAVKSFRAWTYLQLAINYGNIPFVLTPMMTEKEAREALEGPRLSIAEVCDRLIDDITPQAGVDNPDYGTVGNYSSNRYLFYPIRVLLGDLCLWAGRYSESAYWYHSFLTDVKFSGRYYLSTANYSYWRSTSQFDKTTVSRGYSVTTSDVISLIPMETRVFDGIVSELDDIYCSTTDNYYYFQMTPSSAMYTISGSQRFCMQKTNTTGGFDTIYVSKDKIVDPILKGDLRFVSVFSETSMGAENEFSEYGRKYQTIDKLWNDAIPTCRRTMTYLRYAEALNRAGYPQSALCVLKYGLCPDNVKLYIDTLEAQAAGNLIVFPYNTLYSAKEDFIGVHAYGSGDAKCDTLYRLPQPDAALPTRQDTINYQIPLLEDMIITEMALEGAFEGNRYYDLMRVALRRNNPAYLANPISSRTGSTDAALRTLLMNKDNWYLPLPKVE